MRSTKAVNGPVVQVEDSSTCRTLSRHRRVDEVREGSGREKFTKEGRRFYSKDSVFRLGL